MTDDAYLSLVRARIRARRLAAGLTQEEAAERAGLTLRHYQRFEAKGVTKDIVRFNPTIRSLMAISTALETTVVALLAIET